MSERSSVVSVSFNTKSALCCCLKILTESLKIFPRNKYILLLTFILLTLPLSLLHFSLSLTSYPIKSQILHMELVATRASTHFESRQIWRDSREVALSVFRLKLLYFLPSNFFSLIAAITVVISTESAYTKRSTTLQHVVSAVISTWYRPLLTSWYIYTFLLLYSSVPHMLLAVIGSSIPGFRFVVWVVGLGIESYIIAVLGLALVVSITENEFGLDAIRIGWRLMEGRRICGWFLFGFMAAVTAAIGWRMEGLMVASNDSAEEAKWIETVGWEKVVLVGLYGVAIVWGFVVTTVFYCECVKLHVVGRSEAEEEEEQELQKQEEGSLDC
ncbi:uncharacterized protein [Euphorbia lathyris]|uniref:uncharacterized protein n=1 Tax=Euphorbia lathyris TaxID=212925 RepID=UPI0033138906